MKTDESLIPLTPAEFYILLALASGDKQGYQIMKRVRHEIQSRLLPTLAKDLAP